MKPCVAYEEAMPGYEIVGVMHNTWENTDALHCRAKGIADVGMLYVNHMPLLGQKDFQLNGTWKPISSLTAGWASLRFPGCYYKFDDGGFPDDSIAAYLRLSL